MGFLHCLFFYFSNFNTFLDGNHNQGLWIAYVLRPYQLCIFGLYPRITGYFIEFTLHLHVLVLLHLNWITIFLLHCLWLIYDKMHLNGYQNIKKTLQLPTIGSCKNKHKINYHHKLVNCLMGPINHLSFSPCNYKCIRLIFFIWILF